MLSDGERISACFDAFLSLVTIHIWINKIILVGYIHMLTVLTACLSQHDDTSQPACQ
ncbi:hypothetical protein RintRC_7754 [Richelia intracellularis]|nr:hypothetical protein RintRC_7754 [Richelia intracellularis]